MFFRMVFGHRDLKPENIFLADARRPDMPFMVKVLDFGIAKVVADSKTAETTAIGTPQWMAPEQTTNQAVSPAADVWALGLLAFRMLVGCHYWQQANQRPASLVSVMREMVLEPLAPASARAREYGRAQLLPASFDSWFARCVVRETDQRFADAQQAYSAFLAMLRGAPIEPPPLPRPSALAKPVGLQLPMFATGDSPLGGTPLPLAVAMMPGGGTSPGGLVRMSGATRPQVWTVGVAAALALSGGLLFFALKKSPPPPPAPPISVVQPPPPPSREAIESKLLSSCQAEISGGLAERVTQSSRCGELCQKGNSAACLRRGQLLETADASEALTAYRSACTAGLVDGCRKVATLLDKGGTNLSPDKPQALIAFQKLCETHREDAACLTAGNTLLSGPAGIKADPAAAKRLLNAACERKYSPACNRLSSLVVTVQTKCKRGDRDACIAACKKGHEDSCFLVMKEMDKLCTVHSDGTACLGVGLALLTGKMNVSRNTTLGIKRLVAACKLEEERACMILKKLADEQGN
jgi:TPR repeat protein